MSSLPWRALARELRAQVVVPTGLDRAPVLVLGPLALALALERLLPGLLWGALRRPARRRARQAAHIACFRVAGAAALPLAPGRCAAVVLFSAQRGEQTAALVAEARRVLRPGGALIVAQAALPRWRAWARRLRLPVAAGLTPEDFTALLLNAALEDIEQHWPRGAAGPLLTRGRRRSHALTPSWESGTSAVAPASLPPLTVGPLAG
ncbi:MAG: methyltransferase domain-containing protein [Proteobacteria bacterium]|nr:methyltransferase domain-containing protein [Pseudomonadota bacterium]